MPIQKAKSRGPGAVDVVYATDFRLSGWTSKAALAEIDTLLESGFKVGMMQLDSSLLSPRKAFGPEIARVLEHERAWIVSLDDRTRAPLTIVRHPTVTRYLPRALATVRTKAVVLIVNHPPFPVGDDASYDLDDVVDNLSSVFGSVPTVVPNTPEIRLAIDGLVPPGRVADFDWHRRKDSLARLVEDLLRTRRLDDGTFVQGGKYVLCRPRGGINDVLCGIQRTYKYALRHGRILYIDTTATGLCDDFSNYFVTLPSIVVPHPIAEDLWSGLRKFPSVLDNMPFPQSDGEVTNDQGCVVTVDEWGNLLEADGTVTKITFDFRAARGEDILVHNRHGGGRLSEDVWSWIRLVDDLRGHINQTIEKIGEYDAIHVRNTDYRTDYVEFFQQIEERLGEKIVLCTDDPRCREYATNRWGDRVVGTDYVDTESDLPLYYQDLDRATRRRANWTALTDLFLLASARNLYTGSITRADRCSGFSGLATYLHENRSVRHLILNGGSVPPRGIP